LQNQRGGHLIDDAAMILAGVAGLIQNLMSLVCGQALIPQVDGQAGQFAKHGGEGLGFHGLRAEFAAEMDRVADDDGDYLETAAKASKGSQIVTGVALAFQGEDRLRGEAQRVRDRNPDAPVADVESEITGFGGGFQGAAPAFSLPPAGGQRWRLCLLHFANVDAEGREGDLIKRLGVCRAGSFEKGAGMGSGSSETDYLRLRGKVGGDDDCRNARSLPQPAQNTDICGIKQRITAAR